MKRLFLLASILIILATGRGWCDSTDVDSIHIADTLLFDGAGLLHHASPVTSDINFEKRLYQNPTVGLFKSMVVPGWGQLGNHRRTKAVIFAGLDAWFIGAAIHYGKQASDFRDRFNAAVDPDSRNELYDLYLDRTDERNKFTWFAVIITFMSMFDAYVDAHLSGYPVKIDDNDLKVDIRPMEDGTIAAAITVNF